MGRGEVSRRWARDCTAVPTSSAPFLSSSGPSAISVGKLRRQDPTDGAKLRPRGGASCPQCDAPTQGSAGRRCRSVGRADPRVDEGVPQGSDKVLVEPCPWGTHGVLEGASIGTRWPSPPREPALDQSSYKALEQMCSSKVSTAAARSFVFCDIASLRKVGIGSKAGTTGATPES